MFSTIVYYQIIQYFKLIIEMIQQFYHNYFFVTKLLYLPYQLLLYKSVACFPIWVLLNTHNCNLCWKLAE